MVELFDRDRFPCKGNPDWQVQRAATDFYEQFTRAEREGLAEWTRGSKERKINESVKPLFYKLLNEWNGDVKVMMEFINVLGHREDSWIKKDGQDSEVAKQYHSLWKRAHWTYKNKGKEKAYYGKKGK